MHFRVSADSDRQEKKRILLEVIQKIKVNSRDEVHLFLSLPRRISALPLGEEALGSTLQYSAEGENRTPHAGLFRAALYH